MHTGSWMIPPVRLAGDIPQDGFGEVVWQLSHRWRVTHRLAVLPVAAAAGSLAHIDEKSAPTMEFQPVTPDLDIPNVSLSEFVFGGLSEDEAGQVAVIHDATDTRLTFGQVRDHAMAFATWLAGQGIGPGDVVTLVLPNSPEFITAFQGIVRSGAAASAASIAYQVRETAHVLKVAGAGRVVTEVGNLAKVLDAATRVGLTPGDIIVAGPGGREAAIAGGHTAYDDVLATPADPPTLDIDPATHVAALPMSMGYTGLPKAVELSHRNIIANVLQFPVYCEPIPPGSRLLGVVPMSHGYGITALANFGLRRRFPVLTMPAFSPVPFLDLVRTHRPTVLFIVPGIASFLANDPSVDTVDWSCADLAISGASSMDPAVAEALVDRIGCDLVCGWGMTEMSPIASFRPRWRTDIDQTVVGMPVPNVRTRVVDPATGQDVVVPETGESAPGEMWCTGDSVMLRFHNEPEATARMLDADGWLHTGDLVTVDREGCMRIVGRCKELIKSRGLQISPAEIEAVLREHPAVADAAVYPVAIAGSPGDEAPYALIQLKPGVTAKPFDFIRHVGSELAKYKQLKSVVFVDSIPRDTAGQIRRDELAGWASR
ncbi:MAG: 4-coumarate--CoA ligase family protein [Actinomycetales bacterium]|nr:MAG: 4-coumarate--CoA ligase family protein [Actinomycetales bacterium]